MYSIDQSSISVSTEIEREIALARNAGEKEGFEWGVVTVLVIFLMLHYVFHVHF